MASVKLENVLISAVHRGNPKTYDGIVTFHAVAKGLNFRYEHKFAQEIDIQLAINNGAVNLKADLDQLSQATMEHRSHL